MALCRRRALPQSPHGIPARSSVSPKFAMKTRQAFYLHTTKLTRTPSAPVPGEILRPWRRPPPLHAHQRRGHQGRVGVCPGRAGKAGGRAH